MARFFRIHPALGVARMGNSPSHFIGPETPGLPPNSDDGVTFNSFRDQQGRVLRQGARFRVFEYTKDVNGALANPVEVAVGNGILDIEWRVHLANRKSSFYSFYGQVGADDTFLARSKSAPNASIKPASDTPQKTNLRNATVTGDRAAQLEIDPGEQVISHSKPADVELSNPNAAIPIASLGTLRLDPNGRLIVLGGYGQSNFRPNGNATAVMDDYANNDNWFDDAGDGSVKARIRLSNGDFVDADPAWVLVGPPDFAPATGNVVTLFDTVWDAALRAPECPASASATPLWARFKDQKAIWQSNGATSLKGFKPSFTRDIYPLLKNALATRDVHKSGDTGNDHYHQVLLRDYAAMSAISPTGTRLRNGIFAWLRDPDGADTDWKKMPRGLGDDYTDLYTNTASPEPKCFLSLTRVQFAIMREWANDSFEPDWPGTEPVPKPNPNPSPDDLDQAAAQNSVGGPFYPGIDCSWLIRTKELYSEPFRFKISAIPESEKPFAGITVGALTFCTGFFSQQMALPWQADFYDCHKERWEDPDSNELFFMWWTAHRPDDVFPSGGSKQVRWVRSFDVSADVEQNDADPDRFKKMQAGWFNLKFVTVPKDGHYEEEP